jgi:hypothetical protein
VVATLPSTVVPQKEKKNLAVDGSCGRCTPRRLLPSASFTLSPPSVRDISPVAQAQRQRCRSAENQIIILSRLRVEKVPYS